MKTKYITTLVLEGANGVGKSTLTLELFKLYNYRYMIYHRGELSNLLYAKKYNRPFSQTQCGLPFLHILLTCDKKELAQRIMQRGGENDDEVQLELNKIDEQNDFVDLALRLGNDYHIIIFNTTGMTPSESAIKLKDIIDDYIKSLPVDEKMSEWNEMYLKGCQKLGIEFKSRDNQLYFNDILTMSEYTLQNGVYEMYTDKTYPDNLIFMKGYSDDIELMDKELDFAYIINSKILKRKEVYDYYKVFDDNNLKFLTSDNNTYIPLYKNRVTMERAFGDNFIKQLSRARATVYCSRDLATRKLQTARLYEGIRAKQIVFVDKLTDINNEMLKQIYDRQDLIDLLSVTPETIVNNYKYILENNLTEVILEYQDKFYNNILKVLDKNGYK